MTFRRLTRASSTRVVAGLLKDADGKVLLAQRPMHKNYGGHWELPGGKVEPNETDRQALDRELSEELGISATHAHPIGTVPSGTKGEIVVAVFELTAWQGTPFGAENQVVSWKHPRDSSDLPQTPATRLILNVV